MNSPPAGPIRSCRPGGCRSLESHVVKAELLVALIAPLGVGGNQLGNRFELPAASGTGELDTLIAQLAGHSQITLVFGVVVGTANYLGQRRQHRRLVRDLLGVLPKRGGIGCHSLNTVLLRPLHPPHDL